MTRQGKYCPYCGSCQERYHSVESAARILDSSPDTIRDWIKTRKIASVKIGRLRRIPDSAIEKMTEIYPALDDELDEILAR